MAKYYNETDYIENKDINAMIDLLSARSAFESIKNEEYRKYRDVIPMYDEFLQVLSTLLQELPINKDELTYSVALDFLIHNGYLSKDGFFIFQKYSIRELRIAQGINVITGEGCCRNTSEFFERLFSKMNLNGKITYVNTSNEQTFNFKNNSINHAVNEINFNDKKYLYDLIAHRLFKFNNEYELIDLDSEAYLYFKPYGDVVFKSKDYYEMEKRLLEYRIMSKNNTISKKEFIILKNSIINTLNNNGKIIGDFVKNTTPLVEDIYKFMNRVPKILKK